MAIGAVLRGLVYVIVSKSGCYSPDGGALISGGGGGNAKRGGWGGVIIKDNCENQMKCLQADEVEFVYYTIIF